MLPDPATFGRLILSFHKCKSYSVLKRVNPRDQRDRETPQNRNAGAYQRTFGCQGRGGGGLLKAKEWG
jgi:hypothetical protein